MKLNLVDKLIGFCGYQWLDKKRKLAEYVEAIFITNNLFRYLISLIRYCSYSLGICYKFGTQNQCMMTHLFIYSDNTNSIIKGIRPMGWRSIISRAIRQVSQGGLTKQWGCQRTTSQAHISGSRSQASVAVIHWK